jgi:hypothetical protein
MWVMGNKSLGSLLFMSQPRIILIQATIYTLQGPKKFRSTHGLVIIILGEGSGAGDRRPGVLAVRSRALRDWVKSVKGLRVQVEILRDSECSSASRDPIEREDKDNTSPYAYA